jgi:hypothetical protein
MKILLIQPPRHPHSLVFGEMEPYALEVLGACLQQDPDLEGQIEVEILDLTRLTEQASGGVPTRSEKAHSRSAP